jgi:sulfonate transport system substrate-binding protein
MKNLRRNLIMKKVLKTIIALSLALSLVGCSSAGNSTKKDDTNTDPQVTGTTTEDATSTEDLPVLRVAMMPFITSLPAQYIKANKLDEKNGFKMETTMYASGAPMNEALAADLWDVGAMGAAAVTGVANYDMAIIGEVLESQDGLGVFVKPDSKIAAVKGFNPSYPNMYGDPASVKGITILLPIGTAQHFTALKWLEKVGVKAEDVNIVNMDTAQAYQALQAGQADAVALNVPTFFDAKNDGMVQVGNLADMGTKYVDMVTANKKSLDSKSEIIQKYIELLAEAGAALNADSDMATQLMMDYLKEAGAESTQESVSSDLGRVKFIEASEWETRDLGSFAKELGQFYIGVGQLEASLMDKFETSIVKTYVENLSTK